MYSYAQEILPGLNTRGANTSKKRKLSTVELDNLSGIIAEFACWEIMKRKYGNGKIFHNKSTTSRNQIDLELYNGKTIEVRSSCVRNGIDFALFSRNKYKREEQYFDVIGPYSNGYKPDESLKDYYMRVLYECNKSDFMKLLEEPSLRLYITGGATKEMMINPKYYQIKHLTPSDGEVEVDADYRVIPLAKSLDIRDFFRVLENENQELVFDLGERK